MERSDRSADDRRGAILRATVDLLVEVGLARARTRDVTERSGVGTGLLNHYFRWSDLRATAWGLIFDDVIPRQFGAALSPADAMDHFFAQNFTPDSEPFWRLWLEASEMAGQDPAMSAALKSAQARLETALGDVLRAGCALGVWTLPEPGDTALRLIALHDGLAALLMTASTSLDAASAERHMRRAFALECA
ncbi:TetR family transcriptional regulator C-terminal domain-containing protein [Phenylobacterium sp.]|jgi:AcrR family transcriptional regulator|uniref:TetR family transcriptional regulator C-terminal domain-containing protein n=1 Tax=Phenylobacterium sp. TaxID=1871053 RepID=UPI0037C6DB7F